MSKYDFKKTVNTEISLEGLDGITLECLKLRLKECQNSVAANFSLPISNETLSFLWKQCIQKDDVFEFFALPSDRDLPTGGFVDTGLSFNLTDTAYPLVMLKEKNVYGSCADFYTRIDVTSEARLMSMDAVVTKWGDRFVIVASADLRRKTLFGANYVFSYQLDYSIYCLMEVIGRSRYVGSITGGKNGLKTLFGNKLPDLSYVRNRLMQRNFIFCQNFQLISSGNTLICILIQLTSHKRFHASQSLTRTKKLIDYLQCSPYKCQTLAVLDKYMSLTDKKFRSMNIHGIFRKTTICINKYIEQYPENVPAFMQMYTEDHFEKLQKSTRIVAIVYLNSDFQSKLDNLMVNLDIVERSNRKTVSEFMDYHVDEGFSDQDIANLVKKRYHFVKFGIPSITIICNYLKYTKEIGTTFKELSIVLGYTYYESRRIMEHLFSMGIVTKIKKDNGRQRIHRYILKKYLVSEEIFNENMKKEMNLMKNYVSDISKSNVKVKKFNVQMTEKKFDNGITYRCLKRMNIILKMLSMRRIIISIYLIQKRIVDLEASEGYEHRICRKSLLRILRRMQRENKIKILEIDKNSTDLITTNKLMVIYLPSIEDDNPDLLSMLDVINTKMKPSTDNDNSKVRKYNDGGRFMDIRCLNANVENYVYDPDISISYGYKPRYTRLKLLHQYLHYLTYCRRDQRKEGCLVFDYEEVNNSDAKVKDITDHTIYHSEFSFKRFIMPLNRYKDFGTGWALYGDILMLLPLYLFCSIIRISHKIPLLIEYMDHQEKRLLCMHQLPIELLATLMRSRLAIHKLINLIQSLTLIGLVTIGPSEYKEKEYLFIYVKRYATVIDTTKSACLIAKESKNPDIDSVRDVSNLPKLHFDFYERGETDVINYWISLRRICAISPTDNIAIPCDLKKTTIRYRQAGKQALRQRTLKEAYQLDDGTIPGNRWGAGGIDSSLYSYMARNWSIKFVTDNTYTRRISMAPPPTPSKKPSSTKDTRKRRERSKPGASSKPIEKFNKMIVKKKDADNIIAASKKKIPTSKSKAISKPLIKKAIKQNHAIRANQQAKDRQILLNKGTSRTIWSKSEDTLLICCKVTNLLLTRPKVFAIHNWDTIQSLIHELIPESVRDKDRASIIRRNLLLSKNPKTAMNLQYYMQDILSDESFVVPTGFTPRYLINHEELFCRIAKQVFSKLKNINKKAVVQQTLPNNVENIRNIYDVTGIPKSNFAMNVKASMLPVHKITYSIGMIEPRNVNDIIYSTLHNVIHAAMLLNDKTGRKEELYHIFDQFSNKFICNVFTDMYREQLITKIKTNEMRKYTSNSLPDIGVGHYQVSQRYMLRWFSPFSRDIFSELLENFNVIDFDSDIETNASAIQRSRIKWIDKFDDEEEEEEEEEGEVDKGEDEGGEPNAEDEMEIEEIEEALAAKEENLLIEEAEKVEMEVEKQEKEQKKKVDDEVELNKEDENMREEGVGEKNKDHIVQKDLAIENEKVNLPQMKTQSCTYLRRKYNETRYKNTKESKPDDDDDKNSQKETGCTSTTAKSKKRKAKTSEKKSKKNKQEKQIIILNDTGGYTSLFLNLMPLGCINYKIEMPNDYIQVQDVNEKILNEVNDDVLFYNKLLIMRTKALEIDAIGERLIINKCRIKITKNSENGCIWGNRKHPKDIKLEDLKEYNRHPGDIHPQTKRLMMAAIRCSIPVRDPPLEHTKPRGEPRGERTPPIKTATSTAAPTTTTTDANTPRFDPITENENLLAVGTKRNLLMKLRFSPEEPPTNKCKLNEGLVDVATQKEEEKNSLVKTPAEGQQNEPDAREIGGEGKGRGEGGEGQGGEKGQGGEEEKGEEQGKGGEVGKGGEEEKEGEEGKGEEEKGVKEGKTEVGGKDGEVEGGVGERGEGGCDHEKRTSENITHIAENSNQGTICETVATAEPAIDDPTITDVVSTMSFSDTTKCPDIKDDSSTTSNLLQNNIYECIESIGAMGIKKTDLTKKFLKITKRDLFDAIINDLLKSFKILRVGIENYRYVTYSNSRVWTIHSKKSLKGRGNMNYNEYVDDVVDSREIQFRNVGINAENNCSSIFGIERIRLDNNNKDNKEEVTTDRPKRIIKLKILDPEEYQLNSSPSTLNYKRVKMLPRPWRTPECTVNHPTLKLFLQCLLMVVVTNPAAPIHSLVNKYHPLLQPIIVLEIVEMLEQIGCIKMVHYSKPTPQFSVFNKKRCIGSEVDEIGDDLTLSYCYPTLGCIYKLGQFLNTN